MSGIQQRHPFAPSCNCDSCFTIWRAEAEIAKAEARRRGEQRRSARTALWEELLTHFEKIKGDTDE